MLDSTLNKYSGIRTITVDSGTTVSYAKIGYIVNVAIRYTVATTGTIAAWGSKFLGTMPDGYIPNLYFQTKMVTDRNTSIGATAQVGTDGKIYVAARYSNINDTSEILNASFCYISV